MHDGIIDNIKQGVQNFQVSRWRSKKDDQGFLTPHESLIMTSKTSPRQAQLNHRADALNKNRGTPGTNPTNAKAHGNRGKQLNPNQARPAHQSKPSMVVDVKRG